MRGACQEDSSFASAFSGAGFLLWRLFRRSCETGVFEGDSPSLDQTSRPALDKVPLVRNLQPCSLSPEDVVGACRDLHSKEVVALKAHQMTQTDKVGETIGLSATLVAQVDAVYLALV